MGEQLSVRSKCIQSDNSVIHLDNIRPIRNHYFLSSHKPFSKNITLQVCILKGVIVHERKIKQRSPSPGMFSALYIAEYLEGRLESIVSADIIYGYDGPFSLRFNIVVETHGINLDRFNHLDSNFSWFSSFRALLLLDQAEFSSPFLSACIVGKGFFMRSKS